MINNVDYGCHNDNGSRLNNTADTGHSPAKSARAERGDNFILILPLIINNKYFLMATLQPHLTLKGEFPELQLLTVMSVGFLSHRAVFSR